ncbi:ankyrin repeat-containing domain protein [Lophiotrema nucula]|uniref:Ankyrin repeat-containing domain protein n=1 Tax=Lophiotrema nucula TaxID=690887 RepID=A0A6A5Z8X6_9PLEO|nr:ankyrin repeat-containing domain protein [Lophiotrema nucula]
MELLDFPPEMFQRIVHEFVSEVGVDKAWKLREVCKTFAGEIRHDIVANQPLTAFQRRPSSYRSTENKLATCVAGDILLHRTKKLLDVNPLLPNLIQDTVKALLRYGNHGEEPLEQSYLKELCLIIPKSLNVMAILRSGQLDRMDSNTQLMIQPVDELAAAVAMKNLGLVRALLLQIPFVGHEPSHLFGNPLIHAATRGYTDIISAILHENWIQATEATLNEPKTKEIFNRALTSTILSGRLEATKVFVQWYQSRKTVVPKKEYNTWLKNAIFVGNLKTLDYLLGVRITGEPRVTLTAFKKACSRERIDIVSALFGKGRMAPNTPKSKTSPLYYAIRTGDVEIVGIVLKAGANPNGCTTPDKTYPPLIQAAMCGGREMVDLLLGRGASFQLAEGQDILAHTAIRISRRGYDIIREAKMEREQRYVATYDEAILNDFNDPFANS